MEEIFTFEQTVTEHLETEPKLIQAGTNCFGAGDLTSLGPIGQVEMLLVLHRAFFRLNKNQVGETPFVAGFPAD